MHRNLTLVLLPAICVLAVVLLISGVCATTVPGWMCREGTLQHAMSLSDGSRVSLDAVVIDKIKPKEAVPYIIIHEFFAARERLIVLAVPSSRLCLGQTIDVDGVITRLDDGQRAIVDAKISGYLDKSGNLLVHGPLVKGLLKPTPWDWKTDLTEYGDSTPPYNGPLPLPNGEPNTVPSPGPVYYPAIGNLLRSESPLVDGALAHFQCRPVVDSGTDELYGSYFIMGEDSSTDVMKVFCQTPAHRGDRVNKISGQMRFDGKSWVLCVDSGFGYDHQVYVGHAYIIRGSSNARGGASVLYTGDPGESIPYAKTFADTTQVTISGKVVTANRTDFPNALYVEEPDRSSAIRVHYTGTVYPNRGDIVNVTGNMATAADGEREIDAGTTGVTFVQQDTVPSPAGMTNKSLGGGSFNVYTPGVNYPTGSGVGLHNKGLLVKSWGTVTAVNSTSKFFYVDDGTGFQDGSGNTGVKVSWDWTTTGKPAIVPPQVGWYVSIVGLSSSETTGGNNLVRVLRPRIQSDVAVHSPSDVTPPSVSVTMPPDGELRKDTNRTTVRLAGTASDAETSVTSVEVIVAQGFNATVSGRAILHQ